MPSTRSPTQARAVGSVALAAVLIGTTGTAASLGPDSVSGVAAGSWRAVIGATGLVLVAMVRGQAPWRYSLPVRWVGFGAVAVMVNQLAFLEAISRTGVAIGTLVTIGTMPVVAGLADWLLLGRRPRAGWLMGVVVAVAGIALLTGSGEEVAADGVALAAVAGASGILVGLSAQRLMEDRPMVPAMATVIGTGAVLLVPVAAATADDALASPGSTATVVYLGLVTMTAAYVLWGNGLAHLSLSMVAAVTLLEPAVAATLAVTVLDESFSVAFLIGVVAVLAGVGLASRHPPAVPA